MIKSIRFPAEHWDADAEDFIIEDAIFEVGEAVARLEIAFLVGTTNICVNATNGSQRVFVFMNTAIMGAVEIEEFTPIQGSGNVIAFPSR